MLVLNQMQKLKQPKMSGITLIVRGVTLLAQK